MLRLTWSALALVLACSERAPVADVAGSESTTNDWAEGALSDATVAQLAEEFLNDSAFRRATLRESLLVTSNTYAQERLLNYAQPTGWDALPVFNPPVAELQVDDQGLVSTGDHSVIFDEAMATDATSWDVWQWEELGKRAFHTYPAQRATLLERDLSVGETCDPRRIAAFGLWQSNTRTLGGLTSARYPDGSSGLALTCSSCHSRADSTRAPIDGPPSDINLTAFSPDVYWGPGRVDVTADEVDNPVAIADLRATRSQRRLHYSGNLSNSLGALVVRIETLLITNLNAAVRPPRAVAFALAVYVWRLGEQLREGVPGQSIAKLEHGEGEKVFSSRCQTCHAGEWGEGDWVPVDAVGTDPLVAQSRARGTGGYRVPSLIGFDARQLSHEAQTGRLETWLFGAESQNFDTRPGHLEATGSSPLGTTERSSLLAFLHAAFATPE